MIEDLFFYGFPSGVYLGGVGVMPEPDLFSMLFSAVSVYSRLKKKYVTKMIVNDEEITVYAVNGNVYGKIGDYFFNIMPFGSISACALINKPVSGLSEFINGELLEYLVVNDLNFDENIFGLTDKNEFAKTISETGYPKKLINVFNKAVKKHKQLTEGPLSYEVLSDYLTFELDTARIVGKGIADFLKSLPPYSYRIIDEFFNFINTHFDLNDSSLINYLRSINDNFIDDYFMFINYKTFKHTLTC